MSVRPNSAKHCLIKAVLCLLASVLLCACSTLPLASRTMKERQYHPQIEMSGRLSVQYQHNQQPQAVHVRFHWSQTTQQTEVTLTSPTGQTLAALLVNGEGARLNQAGQPPRFARDVDQLMLDIVGWPLPVAHLRDWLQGFWDPDHRYVMPSNDTDTYFITNDGWNVSYPVWEKESAETNSERPKRIDLTGQNEQGTVSVRIVIDEWIPQ
jgi:outer membrane lipoprotein LolB